MENTGGMVQSTEKKGRGRPPKYEGKHIEYQKDNRGRQVDEPKYDNVYYVEFKKNHGDKMIPCSECGKEVKYFSMSNHKRSLACKNYKNEEVNKINEEIRLLQEQKKIIKRQSIVSKAI
jgi:hypothetical protein